MLCFVETDDLSSPLCAPSPTGGSTPCPVGRDPCIPPFCSCHSEFVGAGDSVRPHALAWESAPPKRRADCRVAALLAMTARRCHADGTSGRRPLRVVQRTCPVGRDPCVPSLCSCYSEFVGADDSVRPHALAWESAFPKRRTDCRVASLLAMTARRCRADGTSGRRPLRVVQLFRQSQRRGFAPPLLFCRSEQQKMQFMQEHPA